MTQKFVSNSSASARMFKNNLFEAFSKTHFAIPLLIFLPVASYFLYRSLFVFQTGIIEAVLLFAAGAFAWTLTEYLMHRFLFHYEPSSALGKRIHFVFHGVHHDYPNDAMRLVMAPGVSIPLAFIYYYSFKLLLGEASVAPFFSGFVMGYLFYDMTHYALHHLQFKNKFWVKLKANHMLHHYRDHDSGYGVSSKLWDKVFGTEFSSEKSVKKEGPSQALKDSERVILS